MALDGVTVGRGNFAAGAAGNVVRSDFAAASDGHKGVANGDGDYSSHNVRTAGLMFPTSIRLTNAFCEDEIVTF